MGVGKRTSWKTTQLDPNPLPAGLCIKIPFQILCVLLYICILNLVYKFLFITSTNVYVCIYIANVLYTNICIYAGSMYTRALGGCRHTPTAQSLGVATSLAFLIFDAPSISDLCINKQMCLCVIYHLSIYLLGTYVYGCSCSCHFCILEFGLTLDSSSLAHCWGCFGCCHLLRWATFWVAWFLLLLPLLLSLSLSALNYFRFKRNAVNFNFTRLNFRLVFKRVWDSMKF